MVKLFRTIQTSFPYLLGTKIALMRLIKNFLGIPSEKDFYALSLFPCVENALFLDIGANRGQSCDAILMKTKNSNIRIQLFEPNTLLYEKLEHLFGDNKSIVINAFGLGEKTTEEFLYIPYYKKWMFDGIASLYKERPEKWLKNKILFYRERYLTIKELRCQIKRLDELDLDPFFIKLDIEGGELNMLKGGKSTIKTYEPILLIECPSKEIIDYLGGFGYQFYAVKKGNFYPGVRGVLNTFFMTEGKASLVKGHIKKVQ